VRGGHRVELERVRQVDPDALAAGLAGADAAGPGVEQGQQPVPLAGREDRPVPRVVRRERLQRRVELDPRSPSAAMFSTSATAASRYPAMLPSSQSGVGRCT